MKQSITPAPPSANTLAPSQLEIPLHRPHPLPKPAIWRSKLSPRSASLLLAAACGASTLIPRARLDWLNAIPAVLAISIGIRAFGWSSRSAALRAGVAALCLMLSAEFCLRTTSYHRSLQYERQGNLLFTPAPDQEYVEKISLSPSRINSVGLRGEEIDRSPRAHLVLALGDSITYGYGVDDHHTYPALLEDALSRNRKGQFSILNAGVNAYPMSFMRQKFLYLWARGVHPDIAIIGYSMNEVGWIGNLVQADESTKRQFARRVWLKNHLRRSALYNVIVENWARAYYDSVKSKLVPGTNSASLSDGDFEGRYDRELDELLSDLRIRHVTPILLLFCSYNGAHRTYDSTSPLQQRFAAFAQRHGVLLLRTDEILADAAGGVLSRFFIDQCHMNGLGTSTVALRLSDVLSSLVGSPALRQ